MNNVIKSENIAGERVYKERNSNIELYRIITMLLIVAHHYVVTSGLTAVGGPVYADALSSKSIYLLLYGAWGKIGINCFVLITGYFMCKSNITLKKFMKLFLEIMFYKIVISAIFLITGYQSFSIVDFARDIIPFRNIAQNFTGCYVVFFLTIPFLNILVNNLTEKQHLKLLALVGFIYVFFGTVPGFSVRMNYVSWYIVLYFIGSYIRLYPKEIFNQTKLWGWLTLVFVGLSALSVVACAWLGTIIERNTAYYFVTDSNTFLAVATGVCSFMFFKNLKIKNSKFINTVAASTFGVLLIHSNSDTMRNWLWIDILKNVEMYDNGMVYIHSVLSVVGIFAICIIIDIIRIRIIEKPLFRLYDKYFDVKLKKGC
ncbi:MAG: acyltransferase [Eubacteriales bacterium]|nr:acyltransferase [Eubacteriales bacterium]